MARDPLQVKRQFISLREEGRLAESLLHLEDLGHLLPSLADHLAMWRGKTLRAIGDHDRAAQVFELAIESPNREVKAEARVERVRSLLEGDRPGAGKELGALLRRYPALPDTPALRLELARSLARTGRTAGAARVLRKLDLLHPGYPIAEEARALLGELKVAGTRVAPYSDSEQVDRAERLLRSGAVDAARSSILALWACMPGQQPTAACSIDSKPGTELQPRIRKLAARLAVYEGRLEDASRIRGATKRKTRAATPGPSEIAARRLLRIWPKRSLKRLMNRRLSVLLEVASDAHDGERMEKLLEEISRRKRRAPRKLRHTALRMAAGLVSPQAMERFSGALRDDPVLGMAARYHHARSLLALGAEDAAYAEWLDVSARDRKGARFYGMLAEQQLRRLAGELPAGSEDDSSGSCELTREEPASSASSPEQPGPMCAALPSLPGNPYAPAKLTLPELGALLKPIAEQHREAYPWLQRALDLLTLREGEAASDELFQTYIAWRAALGRPGVRAGKVSVFTRDFLREPPRTRAQKLARLRLNARQRQSLAFVADQLGDRGTAVGIGGLPWARSLPRPHTDAVMKAATLKDLDPDLIYAVMRTESAYQHRIVSRAGAVGLAQIMPRTGRAIADNQGLRKHLTTDLLDPEHNLQLAAWYLGSLLQRWNGHIPLALASYNGGPHNVRKWLRRFGSDLPLDAFLERIPFRETRRYVRRVLGFYAGYRAQRGLPLPALRMRLPSIEPDPVAF